MRQYNMVQWLWLYMYLTPLQRAHALPSEASYSTQSCSLEQSSSHQYRGSHFTTQWQTGPRSCLPEGSWDSHMHVIDPIRYPLDPTASYTTGVHGVWDAVTNENMYGMERMVIVQPSIYRTNNSLLLDALKALGPDRARAVVVVNPDIDSEILEQWHQLGVRGVRLNYVSDGKPTNATEFANDLKIYADLVRPFGWVLQAFAPLEVLSEIKDVITTLDITLVLDHFGYPSIPRLTLKEQKRFDPYSVKGFDTLVDLLKAGRTWVKVSAAYRIEPSLIGLEVLTREILKIRTDRTIFATDWPHTEYEDVDIQPFIAAVHDWSEDFNCVAPMFAENAKLLWGM